MLDLDYSNKIGNAASGDGFKDAILGNSAGADSARTPQQNALHRIPGNLAGYTAGPSHRWAVEPLALPPIWIAPGRVHGGFETAGQCLAQLIAGAHQRSRCVAPASWNARC